MGKEDGGASLLVSWQTFFPVGVKEKADKGCERRPRQDGASHAMPFDDDPCARHNPNKSKDKTEDLSAAEKGVFCFDNRGFQPEAGRTLRFRHGENSFGASRDTGPIAFQLFCRREGA